MGTCMYFCSSYIYISWTNQPIERKKERHWQNSTAISDHNNQRGSSERRERCFCLAHTIHTVQINVHAHQQSATKVVVVTATTASQRKKWIKKGKKNKTKETDIYFKRQ